MAVQQLSNGRNVSGSWAVTETLNAWYEPKDHSIAVCYGYIEEAIANPRRPIAADANTDFTSAFRGISDMTGHADGFVSVENDPNATFQRFIR